MNIRLFYHSVVSDWNHGNAHFLRGVATELVSRGHDVKIYEPAGGWSRCNLIAEHGEEPIRRFHAAYPWLRSVSYDADALDLNAELADADLVVVHEWNTPDLVKRIGEARRRRGFVALFHDTHHRLVTAPNDIQAYDIRHYDGVLAYGRILRDLYLSRGITKRAWTWHEAADTRRFRPMATEPSEGDLVWVGNWGDGERTDELQEFLLQPVKTLGLKARVYGVRYPDHARAALAAAGIEYAGWLPNIDVPSVFARFKVTMHIPRRPYVRALPGIPTIRPFEALACGMPLLCSPWPDTEHLFGRGDFERAENGREMTRRLEALVGSASARRRLARQGRATIQARHTCAHRADELLNIFDEVVAGSGHRAGRAAAESRLELPAKPLLATP